MSTTPTRVGTSASTSADALRDKVLAHGLRLTHTHHAHALHAPYWWLKCAVGTEKSDHPAVTAYHKLLVWDMMGQPWLTRTAESALNPLIGKSVAMYFTKPVVPVAVCLTFPHVPGVLTPAQCRQTAQSIAATQESSGAIPWFDGGHTDPWDHVENAMALTAAGLLEPARAAFEWCRSDAAAGRLLADPDPQRRHRGRQQRQQLLRLRRDRCLAPRAGHR